MSRLPHPPRLYNSNYTWRRVQIMKFLVMQLSPPSRHSIQIFSSTPCSQTPSVYVPPTVRDHVSHPYRTTGKIIVLYILTFTHTLYKYDEYAKYCHSRDKYPAMQIKKVPQHIWEFRQWITVEIIRLIQHVRKLNVAAHSRVMPQTPLCSNPNFRQHKSYFKYVFH
jgi:hypothetical protein